MPPRNLHHHWNAPSSRPTEEDGVPPKKTVVANDHHRSETLTINVSRSRSNDTLEKIDDGGALDGVEGSACRVRPAYPHGLHRHWHASSKISGHDGGNHHRSDYVINHLDKIDEGSGSVGSRSSEREIITSQSSKEKKEPFKQFYDNQFALGRHHGLVNNVDDSLGIESVWSPSFVMLSEAFVDRSSQEGDACSTTSSISEQNSQYYPSQEKSRSIDSFYSHHVSYYSHSPSNSSSYISTVSSVTLSRALDDELEWRCSNNRGFCVSTRLGDFVEDLDKPSPKCVSLAPNVIELHGEEDYFVDKDSQNTSLLALLDFGRIFTVKKARPTAKLSSAEEAFTTEAVLATATEALIFSDEDG